MICTPLSVLMMSLISPTLSAYVASSNGFCIWPYMSVTCELHDGSNSKQSTHPAKRAEVAAVLRGRAVRVHLGEFCELLGRAVDLLLVALEDLDRLLLRSGNIRLFDQPLSFSTS